MLSTEAQGRGLAALIIGGAIDGIVAERLADEEFDVTSAADLLVSLLPGH